MLPEASCIASQSQCSRSEHALACVGPFQMQTEVSRNYPAHKLYVKHEFESWCIGAGVGSMQRVKGSSYLCGPLAVVYRLRRAAARPTATGGAPCARGRSDDGLGAGCTCASACTWARGLVARLMYRDASLPAFYPDQHPHSACNPDLLQCINTPLPACRSQVNLSLKPPVSNHHTFKYPADPGLPLTHG